MRGQKKILLVIGLVAMMGLSGCSSSETDNLLESGIKYIQDHDYASAKDTLEKALEKGADEHDCYRALGICSLELGDYDKAIEYFKTSLSSGNGIIHDVDFDTNFYLAKAYYLNGDYADAVNVYNAILNLRSNDKNAIYMRGVCYLEQGNHDKAMEDFSQVMKLDSKGYDRIIEIYQLLAAKGYGEEGLEILEGVWDPSHMTNYELGQISFYLGNNAQAQNYLELARNEKSEADKSPIILLLGQTGEKQGDFNYAISVYRSYLEETGEHAEIYNRLGLCEMQMAEAYNDVSYYNMAISDFEAGLALDDPNENKALLRNEITAYEYTGDFESANTLMNKYLSLYPDDEEAKREAIFISTRIG
ncbi:Tfp pilus assembly protein PilF [Butyrivibrio fibrisolvens DSM 3071]|uniref:Tfp pilus assembly protein PilF n=1 Tax=Butyrivibrio fibrisolvens DSM 3071 TaxID=1121131 RepID=A0A1M5ZU04_BUTFI|nr:tetratricopeptide repeat protein [Butyrivibrio fibrisolvens]SHI27741.1 Tfp pilus assembly protein PilF [Butyrivibrio fibrisolvens DSM 3071]